MKINLLLYSFVLLLVFSACKKQTPAVDNLTTEISGRVLLRGTNHKATNQPVNIKVFKKETRVMWYALVEVTETHTDTNGNYSVSFKAENDYTDYYIEAQTELDNHWSSINRGSNIKVGQKQTIDLLYTAHAWIRFHYKNINPHTGDIVRSNLGGGVVLEFHGPANQQYIHKVGGNVDFEFSYTVVRNGIPNQTIYTIFAPAFDTTYHLIEYY